MGAHAVITHALNSDVSLAKPGDAPVPTRVPVSGTTMINIEGEAGWWGVPAYVVRAWITGHLARGRYAQAARLSVHLHQA
jgi:hypothetical protein